jgi:hypothetical protein
MPMHGVAGPLVKIGRLLGRSPDGCQAEPSVDGEALQHVHTTPVPVRASNWRPSAATARLSVAQYHRWVPSDAFRAPASGSYLLGTRSLRDDIRVRCAAHSKVDFERVHEPFPAVVLRKIHAEPPDDSATGEEFANRLAVRQVQTGRPDRPGTGSRYTPGRYRRQAPARVWEHIHVSEGRDLNLDTRAPKVRPNELLGNCTGSKMMDVPVRERQATAVEMIKLDDSGAVSGTAVVKLDDHSRSARLLLPDLGNGRQQVVEGADVLPAGRVWTF